MKVKYIFISISLSLFYVYSFGHQTISKKLIFSTYTDTALQSKKYWNITNWTGEIIPVNPDTFLTDYFNRTNIEGKGLSIACFRQWGSPAYSQIFFDRKEISQFFFQDAFSFYHKTPFNFNFINTKIPYSNIFYKKENSFSQKIEEWLQTLFTFNVGKKFNIGLNIDFLSTHEDYKSQLTKYTDWIFFGNYLSNHHQIHYFINSNNHIYTETKKIINKNISPNSSNSYNINTNMPKTLNIYWHKLDQNEFFFSYRYNFKFHKKHADSNLIKQFNPILGITYTIDYTNNKKEFHSNNYIPAPNFYFDKKEALKQQKNTKDFTYCHLFFHTLSVGIKNNIDRCKQFDLAIFLIQDLRFFYTMKDIISNHMNKTQQFPIYIGGKLAKRINKNIKYNIQGKIGLSDYNQKDYNLHANIETNIPFFNDRISYIIFTYIKHLSPTFYENYYLSQNFYWNENFNKIKKKHIGNIIYIPSTKTKFQVQFENIINYIYFNKKGNPQSYTKNIQIFATDLIQDFKFNAFHFNSQITYQTSTNQKIIPLPLCAIYSSMYFQFKIADVLTIQTGTNIHFWTKYYAYTYEPIIQQFKLQDAMEIGNYPLINAFINGRLKQTRFFIEYYNVGTKFSSYPNYFSLSHYPINPSSVKFGISICFIN